MPRRDQIAASQLTSAEDPKGLRKSLGSEMGLSYSKKDHSRKFIGGNHEKDYFFFYQQTITYILIVVHLTTGLYQIDKLYTSITFIALSIFLLLHQLIFKGNFMGRFYFAYIFILIPFFMVNGILTGSFIEGEVVWYNNQENLGIRIGTVPVEDIFYGMLLILMNITIFEAFQKQKN